MKGKQNLKDGGAAVSIAAYDTAQPLGEASICKTLRAEIEHALPDATSKVWHGAPVWFLGDVPVVGYSVPAKGGVALLFWNGQVFGDAGLKPVGKFKAAQIQFRDPSEIKVAQLRRWLKKAGTEIWDVSAIREKRARAPKGTQAKKVKPRRS